MIRNRHQTVHIWHTEWCQFDTQPVPEIAMTKIILILLLLLTGGVQAQEQPTWNKVGIHLYTQHDSKTPWFNNHTQGLQFGRSDGLLAGFYCNSFSRKGQRLVTRTNREFHKCEISPYVGWMFETNRDALVGIGVAPTVIGGYRNRLEVNIGPIQDSLLIHPLPNARVGPLRVYMLTPRDYHLAAEWRF
jgi:hypothetical protein